MQLYLTRKLNEKNIKCFKKIKSNLNPNFGKHRDTYLVSLLYSSKIGRRAPALYYERSIHSMFAKVWARTGLVAQTGILSYSYNFSILNSFFFIFLSKFTFGTNFFHENLK